MPYKTLKGITSADEAFEVTGPSLEELFKEAADALLNVMTTDIAAGAPVVKRRSVNQSETVAGLLYEFLQQLLLYKDADALFMRVAAVDIHEEDHGFAARAEFVGDVIDAAKHDLRTDVKAITFHKFSVEKTPGGWRAVIVVDV